jgi:polyisoprenoid-binding protein YceI
VARSEEAAVRRLFKLLTALVLVVVLGAAAVWYFLIRSDPAPRATIKETTTVAAAASELDGSYKVVAGKSENFVGYRVTEKLVASIVQTDATGRTDVVTGTLQISGTTISDVNVTADLRTLTSDRDQRDQRLRSSGIESDRYPQAKFVLTQPIVLASTPTVGQTISADAVGDFTLHGVTKRVTISIQGRWDGAAVQVVGHVPIVFGDYNITAPSSPLVASVDDHGEMEFQLFFRK